MSDSSYKREEEKAREYFQCLVNEKDGKKYIDRLTKDIEWWKKKYTSKFINLNREDRYLDRSISYIYMRDLGKDLSNNKTKEKIAKVVNDIQSGKISDSSKDSDMMVSLYRKAQEENIELTVIWLINKLNDVFDNIPKGIDEEQAKRKLIKIIVGVVMHQIEELEEGLSKEERKVKIEAAIRLGYCYGLTYPFIDDLLDADVLSVEEKEQYSDLINKTLSTREVAELRDWKGENYELIKYIYKELKEAFEYIKANQNEETIETFFNQSYIFFKSQEVDRIKDLNNTNYTSEEIFIPIILKSAASRLIVRSVIAANEDEEFEKRTFYYGIYNQLADDFTDMFDDLNNNSLTPYTYYIKYHKERNDLINPFELYWIVVDNLIHNVYKSDSKTCEIILCRAINSLKRFKARIGNEKYNEIMKIIAPSNEKFNDLIQSMVIKAREVDFLDKYIRDNLNNSLKEQKNTKNDFKNIIKEMQREINSIIAIEGNNGCDKILEAVNHSLEGSAKRLRPIISWNIGVDAYNLQKENMMPLFKSLEYMHTGSLIFDDLPSQDNADLRRGKETLHKKYSVGVAELSGIFMIQRAIEEQTYLEKFDTKSVLKLIRYSSQTVQKMCIGQGLDLESRNRTLTLEELKEMCFYKTGLAFEAAVIMPAILGHGTEKEFEALKEFAYYGGIAFQIKDDLLDLEGETIELGKESGKDIANDNCTFVTVLGADEAKKQMWDYYCKAIEALDNFNRDTKFLKNLMSYVVNRKS